MTILLHVYTPGDRAEDQGPTWDALDASRWPAGSSWSHRATEGTFGYSEALQAVWDRPGDLVLCEQSIVPLPHHVLELVDCPELFCAWSYELASGTLWHSLPGAVGFGLCKISQAAREAVRARPAVPRMQWKGLPPTIAKRLPAPHVHFPMVPHHHGLAWH